ncbi:MAG: dihydroorotate dehydrogenase electron transfer subunit, partial [Deltaproteobacteria bacterium]|nr:dihydroorotate dehydrogenase electron transfer subunit [Deltaproteobacteria bacterium]
PVPPTPPSPGRIELTVRAVGPFTRALMECRPGQLLGLRGPFGRGFELEPRTLLVGGGMGIAPIRFLAQGLDSARLPYETLLGGRTSTDLLFADWFALRSSILHTDDGSLGVAGPVTQSLDSLLASHRYCTVCACGPEPMLLAVKASCEAAAVPYQLAFERYMKCGIGICGQCCMDGTGIRLCKEGPVLTARDLAGITELGLPHRNASGSRCRQGR